MMALYGIMGLSYFGTIVEFDTENIWLRGSSEYSRRCEEIGMDPAAGHCDTDVPHLAKAKVGQFLRSW